MKLPIETVRVVDSPAVTHVRPLGLVAAFGEIRPEPWLGGR